MFEPLFERMASIFRIPRSLSGSLHIVLRTVFLHGSAFEAP
jgi:hypothetical protein